jgi:hypothetical protein
LELCISSDYLKGFKNNPEAWFFMKNSMNNFKELFLNNRPVCGTTTNYLRDLFFGKDLSLRLLDFFTGIHSNTPSYRKIQFKGKTHSPEDFIILGHGIEGLSKLKDFLQDSLFPFFIQFSVISGKKGKSSKGAGHIWSLEALRRLNKKYPLIGLHDQSYIGKHSLSEWNNNQQNKPVNINNHIEQLINLLKKDNIFSFKRSFEQLFLAKGLPRNSTSDIRTKPSGPHFLTIRFLGSPLNFKLAGKNTASFLKQCFMERKLIQDYAKKGKVINFENSFFDEEKGTLGVRNESLSYEEIHQGIMAIEK